MAMVFLSIAIVLLGVALVLSPVCVLAVMWGDRKADRQIRKG